MAIKQGFAALFGGLALQGCAYLGEHADMNPALDVEKVKEGRQAFQVKGEHLGMSIDPQESTVISGLYEECLKDKDEEACADVLSHYKNSKTSELTKLHHNAWNTGVLNGAFGLDAKASFDKIVENSYKALETELRHEDVIANRKTVVNIREEVISNDGEAKKKAPASDLDGVLPFFFDYSPLPPSGQGFLHEQHEQDPAHSPVIEL